MLTIISAERLGLPAFIFLLSGHNPHVMKIVLCAFIACLFVLYVFRVRYQAAELDFAMRGILSSEKLGYMVSSLAYSAKRPQNGRGISLQALRKKLYAARRVAGRRIAEGKEIEECERTYYDNFYIIDEVLHDLASSGKAFRRLPHVSGVPRLYSFCELYVKSVGGFIGRDSLRAAVNAYTSETPFTYAEISALDAMLALALAEYIAIYAEKTMRMSLLVSRGESDAANSHIDASLLRYDSYFYGVYKGKDSGNFSEKRMDKFVLGVAGYNARISSAVRSLHLRRSFITDEFICSLSPVYKLLDSRDKSFHTLSASAKNLYLAEISRRAAREKVTEINAAKEALYRAEQSGKDISHFILPPPLGKKFQRVYILVFCVLAASAAVAFAFTLHALWFVYILLALPIFACASDFILRKAYKYAFRRRHLPSYDPKYLDTEKNRTVILLPCFAADSADIEEAFAHVGTIMAANPEPVFSYCLLFDYPRSSNEISEQDGGLSDKIKSEFEKVGSDRLSVLVRRRKRVKGEEYYQGYEKKRGAILDFNRFVLTGEGDFSLSLGEVKRAKYVITLDSDTVTNDCISLVCTKAHPYCEGAALLSLGCKSSRKGTPYAALYGGETGPGRYRIGSFNPYFDIFGVGNYTGKGIYDVEEFNSRLEGFFPDNAILSHDFIEGAVVGCYESTANAGEDFPQTFAADFARSQRWLRGDWQLLPYVLPRVKDGAGKRVSNPTSPIARFSVALNIMISLLPIAQLAVLVCALFGGVNAAVIILAFLPHGLRLLFSLFTPLRYFRQVLAEWGRVLLEIAALPTVAVYRLCAVCVTLYRLAARRNLLQWSVSAHTKGDVTFLPNLIAAAVFVSAVAVFGLNVFFYIVSAGFVAGAAVFPLLGKERPVREKSAAYMSAVTDAARRTFSYFKAQENMYRLPCDCYQADNAKGWCARTSPTNIGMALVAYVSAYELGIASESELIQYTERIISAVEDLEKYHGNLYNWYDCETLAVLPGRFVSSVDSGNLLASLSLASLYTNGELRERIEKLIDETDLGALYDSRRELLYIGYDDDNKQFTDNHYDLLGSESSLTYLVGCAYGKLPKEAFYNLDRRNVRYGGISVYSWTGGMFEYLMTRIFISPGEGTLFEQAMRGAVRAQIRYAKSQGSNVWGVSECRYNRYDDSGGNLYRAFGVPAIAYSEVPSSHPYAPYAAFLALPYCGEDEFVRNINAFSELGADGEFGYCDSVDGKMPVRSYMTHHQGMIMAACANAAKGDCLVNKLLSSPRWRAAKLLCGEEKASSARRKKRFPVSGKRAAVEISDTYVCRCSELSTVATEKEFFTEYFGKRIISGLGIYADCNGRKSLLHGEFFASSHATWKRREDGFVSETKLSVIPSPLSVAVTVEYRNISSHTRKVRFSTYAEPILARYDDYIAHPAYSRMFIESKVAGKGRYVASRRKGESISVSHLVTGVDGVEYTTDKCTFFGRGRGSEGRQNINPCLSGSFETELSPGQSCNFTSWYIVSTCEENEEQAVKLACTPDCVGRNAGAVTELARAVPANVRKLAKSMLCGEYGALTSCDVPLSYPTVTHEITDTDEKIYEKLSQYRQLYELGFGFNLVFFCRKRKGEYPALYFDMQSAVDKSGIASRAKGAVKVIECDSPKDYEQLRSHAAQALSSKEVYLYNGQITDKAPALPATRRKAYFLDRDFEREEIVRPMGLGGFAEDYSYVLDLTEKDTPAPWCNILSGGAFGSVITESGGGFTFGSNSRQSKLTEWSNDPVSDTVSEFIALESDGEVWSVSKKPLALKGASYETVHGFGYTQFICRNGGLSAKVTQFVPRGESRKIYMTEIINLTDEDLSVGVIAAVRPVLGDFRHNSLPSLTCTGDEHGLGFGCAYSHGEAHLYCDRKVTPIGADIGENGITMYDAPSKQRDYYALTTRAEIPAGERKLVYFALSEGGRESFDHADEALGEVKAFYNRLGRITFDGEYGYLTKWLPYQVYNSRFAARTGFYQVSGAFGFRDQLQDCLALLYCKPEIVREHILECARHQFAEGDVQHWWHPPAIGVRTHICDDKLWLVYLVCEYIAVTGDKDVLSESVSFLRDVPISPQDVSVYTHAEFSGAKASVYEHCLHAIKSATDLDENGLVRMRGGDWNDAMDKVGEKGVGTSVWCTMFLYAVTEKFLPHVKESETRERLIETDRILYGAVTNMYRDERFLRAVCDDGTVLGAPEARACKIDLLTQSWSVLAGIGTREMKLGALGTAYNLLCDGDSETIRLFDPPFTSPDGVGYVGKYPPYVRENGGQYTQAAVWYVYALFAMGQSERANVLLRWLSPAYRSDTLPRAQKYSVEPYVSAADVYGGDLAGKGGWTWYTGSGSWLYKCLLEKYAGITVRGGVVTFAPNLPKNTRELNVNILYGGETVNVKIINSSSEGAWRIRIGEVVYNTPSLKLTKGLSGKKICLIKLLK